MLIMMNFGVRGWRYCKYYGFGLAKVPRTSLLMAERTFLVRTKSAASFYTRTCTASRRIQRAVRCSRLLLVANALAGNAVMIVDSPSRNKRKHERLCNGSSTTRNIRRVLLQRISSFLIGSCPQELGVLEWCPNAFLPSIVRSERCVGCHKCMYRGMRCYIPTWRVLE